MYVCSTLAAKPQQIPSLGFSRLMGVFHVTMGLLLPLTFITNIITLIFIGRFGSKLVKAIESLQLNVVLSNDLYRRSVENVNRKQRN